MDVAEQIIVMNHAVVEQAGTPLELYDEPASEFVMGFVGDAHNISGEWVRPHDIEIHREVDDEGTEALIDRIVTLGFEARVELTLADGDSFTVQTTRSQIDSLELREGEIVSLHPKQTRVFG